MWEIYIFFLDGFGVLMFHIEMEHLLKFKCLVYGDGIVLVLCFIIMVFIPI